MTDYVKKDDIFKYVCMDCKSLALDCKGVNRTPCEKVKAFLRISPANVIEHKRGEWIEHKGRTIVEDNNFIDFFPTEYECSNCGLRQATYFINSKLPNFCPNCGADMRKETVDYKSIILICDEEGNWSMHGERKENE